MSARMRMQGLRILSVVAAFLVAEAVGRGQGMPPTGAPLPTDLNGALSRTIREGTPTVAVVTSRSSPEAMALRDELIGLLARQPIPAAQFVEVPVELDPERVRALNVREFPTVLVYRPEGGRVGLLAHRSGAMTASQLMGWLGSFGELAGGRPAPRDEAVVATGLLHHGERPRPMPTPQVVPTPQQPTPPPPPPPVKSPPAMAPPEKAPPQQAPPMLGVPESQPMSPVIMQQASPPVIVQQPSQAVYVQQSAPKIMLGLAPPPEITIVQGPQQAPTISLATVGVPSQPQAGVPNVFMSPPQPEAPPQQGFPQQGPPPQQGVPSPQQPFASPPAMAPPPQQGVPSFAPVAQGVPSQAMAMATMASPMAMAGAPLQQQSFIGTTAVALLLENPGLIGRFLQVLGDVFSAVGDRLASQGAPRLRMPRQSAFGMPAAGLAMAPVSAVQLASPQMLAFPQMAVPQPEAPTMKAVPEYLAVPVPSPGVTPSPQGPSHQPVHAIVPAKHRLLGRLFGH